MFRECGKNIAEYGRRRRSRTKNGMTDQIPSAAGFAPGWIVQGGNCFGRVRTEGQAPERARLAVSAEAFRRVSS